MVGHPAERPGRHAHRASAPVGSRIEFQVCKTGLLRKRNVTHEAIGISYDPRIARFNQTTCSVTLTRPGTTNVCFYDGKMRTEVPLVAEPGLNPDKLAMEPQKVDLAVGSTARLKVFGEYKDGRRVDLTDAVEWHPQNDGTVFAVGSLVEGLGAGPATVSARYRATPETPYIDASASVTVVKADFQGIEVAVEPKTGGRGPGRQARHGRHRHRRPSLFDPGIVAVEDQRQPPYVATVVARPG